MEREEEVLSTPHIRLHSLRSSSVERERRCGAEHASHPAPLTQEQLCGERGGAELSTPHIRLHSLRSSSV